MEEKMEHGFLRVAAATPKIKVADCEYNKDQMIELIEKAAENRVKVLVFPELCITGYTCSDLFEQDVLLSAAKEALLRVCEATKGKNMVVFVGLPFEWNGCLYNTAAVLFEGEILGLIPKRNIPNYSEFYEARYFTVGIEEAIYIQIGEKNIPFGTNILFECRTIAGLILAAEICEDVWVPCPPSISHALAGATVIANLSASDETTGKDIYRLNLVAGQSARLISGYIYADAGEGESTTDLVFSGHNIIAENGTILKQTKRFQNQMIIADLDLDRLRCERRKQSTFEPRKQMDYLIVPFCMKNTEEKELLRQIEPMPFVPSKKEEREKRCEEILSIQAMGLKKRLEHTNCQNAVVGISGGLDSTLALLVTVRAFDLLGMKREQITAVTMPCFGTTDRTYQNAVMLAKILQVTCKEVPLKEAVLLHFKDIEQDVKIHDVTYENAQARERTQVLMDIANKQNGMVIGTGDMSELALGWATYNGDHMSMYGVNASVPKTLVRYLVKYYADICRVEALEKILLDILDTPVSPELLPPEDGKISQKTEDIVGPYELHDFYLYYILRFGYHPQKILKMAEQAFDGKYERETIKKWLKTFYKRFFSQQFKRSCLPDGPKVGSVAVSPRGDLRMPSDAVSKKWLEEVENF